MGSTGRSGTKQASKVWWVPVRRVLDLHIGQLDFMYIRIYIWDSALLVEDLRRPYGEQRFQALGLTNSRLHMLVFTPRASKAHVISLRKANKREVGAI